MRWENLFEDLEARLEQQERRALELDVVDRTRRERALLGLHERLLAAVGPGLVVDVVLARGGPHRGRVLAVGVDWTLLDGPGVQRVLVPFAAIVRCAIPGGRFEISSALPKRFDLGYALRELSRDRAVVTVTDLAGYEVSGTLDMVGRDMLEIAEHPVDIPRRYGEVLARQVVPLPALASVRSH